MNLLINSTRNLCMKENIQRKKLQRMTCIYYKTQKKVYRSLLFWTKILHWDTKEYKRSSDNKGSTHAKIDRVSLCSILRV